MLEGDCGDDAVEGCLVEPAEQQIGPDREVAVLVDAIAYERAGRLAAE